MTRTPYSTKPACRSTHLLEYLEEGPSFDEFIDAFEGVDRREGSRRPAARFKLVLESLPKAWKILFDHCVDRNLRKRLRATTSARPARWGGTNFATATYWPRRKQAASLLTVDKGFRHQQNLTGSHCILS